jgi:hypothetical protein
LALLALVLCIGFGGCKKKPSPPLSVVGPSNVPEGTEYGYVATEAADWTVTGPGTIAAGQNTDTLTVDWGDGPARGTVTATANGSSKTVSVNVVHLTFQPNPIKGANVEDGGVANCFQYAQTVPPGIQFSVKVTSAGPSGSAWKSRIVAGFVQVLRSAPQWQASYKAPPSPLSPKYTTPPPWHDVINGATTVWYAGKTAGTTYTPSSGAQGTIKMNDSPKPGWWHQNQKCGGAILEEAIVKWEFDTYVCVQTLDAPTVYTIRQSAHWTMDAQYERGGTPQVTGSITLPNPATMTPDAGHSNPSPITGVVTNDALEALTFQ